MSLIYSHVATAIPWRAPNPPQPVISYGYPSDYVLRDIVKQINVIAAMFGFSPQPALDYALTRIPKICLPKEADGWFAFPKTASLANKFFPKEKDPATWNCHAAKVILSQFEKPPATDFRGIRNGIYYVQIPRRGFKLHPDTVAALELAEKDQPGDLLVLPGHFKRHHKSISVFDIRDHEKHKRIFAPEFPAHTIGVAAMLLLHPDRLSEGSNLWIDVPGDMVDLDGRGKFSHSPVFYNDGYGIGYEFGAIGGVSTHYGAATFFLPS